MKLSQVISSKWSGFTSNMYFDNWLPILVQRMFAKQIPLVVFKKNKLTIVVDYEASDHNGIRHCLSSRMYSRYFRHLEKGKKLNVLDLGGNTGGFVFCLVNAGHALSKAVSVEMNPNTFSRLRFNLDYNFMHQVIPLNYAVASQGGVVQIENNKGSTGQSIYEKVPSDKAVTVQAVTFDELVSTYFQDSTEWIDLVKIDVEGAEYEILASATCEKLRQCKHLIIEIHPNSTVSQEDLIRRIESFGFENATDKNVEDKDVFCFRNRFSLDKTPPVHP